MNTFLLLVLGIISLAVIAGGLLWYISRKNEERYEGKYSESLLKFQQELHSSQSSMQDRILDLSKQMNEQMSQNAQILQKGQISYQHVMSDVQHRLGSLQEATQSMVDIGKDISSLQDILRAPKLRGGLGEFLLEELLRQILPEDHFDMQYRFRTGSQVDAIIRLGDGLIPVDAKFPLENFKRIIASDDEDSEKESRKGFYKDIKKHIDDISSKYILPAEGTFEFALMYIPSENIYYEVIIKDDDRAESIAAYAIKKKVIPVSPNSFYAYLQAIVRGLKGLRIERSAQIILESLGQLEVDLGQCFSDLEKLGSHISHASSAYDRSLHRFSKLQNKLNTLGQRNLDVEITPSKELTKETS